MGKERLATSNFIHPPLLEGAGYPPLVEDTLWLTPEVSMSHSDQQGDLSARELQEVTDHFKALMMAQEELEKSLTQPLGSNAS